MTRTHGRNRFETTLTSQVGPSDLIYPVQTAEGLTSPTFMVFEPNVPERYEVILCDGAFDGTTIRSANISSRYQEGSAEDGPSPGITHPPGAVIRMSPVQQMFDRLWDDVEALDLTRVRKSGDTMTGELILPGNPAFSLGAVPKQYVDAHTALTDPHSATPQATPDRLVLRNSGGRAHFADPTLGSHAATRGWVEGNFGEVVGRGVSGSVSGSATVTMASGLAGAFRTIVGYVRLRFSDAGPSAMRVRVNGLSSGYEDGGIVNRVSDGAVVDTFHAPSTTHWRIGQVSSVESAGVFELVDADSTLVHCLGHCYRNSDSASVHRLSNSGGRRSGVTGGVNDVRLWVPGGEVLASARWTIVGYR